MSNVAWNYAVLEGSDQLKERRGGRQILAAMQLDPCQEKPPPEKPPKLLAISISE